MGYRIVEVMEDFQQLQWYRHKAAKYQGVTEGLAIALGMLQ